MNKYERIAELIAGLEYHGSILDAGSGETPLVQAGSFSRRATIDLRSRPAFPDVDVQAVQGDYLKHHFDDPFDVAVCCNVLQFVERPDLWLEKLCLDARYVIVCVPYQWPLCGGRTKHQAIDYDVLSQWTNRNIVYDEVFRKPGDDRPWLIVAYHGNVEERDKEKYSACCEAVEVITEQLAAKQLAAKQQPAKRPFPHRNKNLNTPNILKLETTTRCNACCVFCGHPPGGRDMPWQLYTAVIDAFPNAAEVQPQWWGEPLLWPHIVEGIRYAKDRGKRVAFYTNGSLLSGRLAGAIADAEPTSVFLSVDTHLPEVYEAIRPPLKFARVLRNVEAFQAMKRPGTKTIIRAAETEETSPTMPETVAFWQKRVDQVAVKPEFPRIRQCANAEYQQCYAPAYEMVVRMNGDVCLCCNDWYSQAVIGHVSEGIHQAWAKYERYTKEMHPLCRTCKLQWIPSS